ncbi:CDP-alcohol phosphatidyltransferase-domain-containing protein [Naematelia encephala]|uniref:CDP-diacylglycerol--inositol 3-phosphatidyltransferase n=1 Tax=Naematelia encephala TaxID=71784 RepID=A0A1Y2AGL0_9TREE|nr:CDP-alcohol phosphatidyltransferase-domain-containing protein [Naematelia encephala]
MAPKTRSKQATPEVAVSGVDGLPAPLGDFKSRPREGSRTRQEEVFDPKYAVDLATTTRSENVFLFVPNLIGYARVISAAAALTIMPYHPRRCTLLYFVSCILDVADGHTARALGQTSKFGAVLDMVTDRCTTACLLCFLSMKFPDYSLLFMFLITLDFSSHYIHMYSSLLTGSSSHKTVTSDVSRILWYYYNDSRTLFIFCFCNETFFVCLYLIAFLKDPIHSSWPLSFFVTAQQLHDTLPRPLWALLCLSWPQLVAIITFPLTAGKQIINVVQFWKASKILVGVDLAERQAARMARERKGRGE